MNLSPSSIDANTTLTPGQAWPQSLLTWHAAADLVLGLAFFALPIAVFYVVRQRRDISFHWSLGGLALFSLAGGTMHWLEVWNLWHANYWLSGVTKTVTALAAVLTAFGLARLIPILLARPDAAVLKKAYDELEQRVAERTRQLEIANETLRQEAHERQRAEQEARTSEVQMRAVMDSTLNAVIVVDATGKITDWNARAETVFGWQRTEALGRDLTETIIPARHQAAHQRGMKHYLATGAGPVLNRVMELSALRRDGSEFPVELFISPLKTGATTMFCGFITDLTARKEAERNLRESQNLLQTVIDNSPAVIYVKDLPGRYLLVNRLFYDIFQLTRQNVIGKTDYDLFHPKDAAAFRAMDNRVVTAQRALTEEETAPLDDGLHTYVSVKCPLRDETGKVYAVLGVSTDITASKHAQERAVWLGSFPELNPNPIIELDVETGVVHYANPSAAALFPDIKEKSLRHPILAGLREIAAQLGKTAGKPLRREASFGDNYYSQTLTYIADSQRLRVYSTDITERKAAEEQIRSLNAELEQRVADRTAELEAFSYSVSHDLRAPIRAMSGYARMLQEDIGRQLPAEAAHKLGRIYENAHRMGQLIDGLLAFSRLSRQPIKKQTVALEEIARRVWEDLHLERSGRTIQFSVGPLPECQADATLLHQVFVNLLANAMKYSRRQADARIEVGWDEKQRAYFVKDNGAGFDMQYAGKLFGVFQRLHRADEFEGTGVGLAIVQRILYRHGGKIWPQAAPDQGATFYFTIGHRDAHAQ